jgi:uncharacterized protein YbjT (DUF2867 family)
MAPSILVVGATGNTGRGVVQTLASLLGASKLFSKHRIIGLTRNTKGAAAQELARIPHVEMMQKNWTMINADWLREHQVQRLFIACPVSATQFTDESLFLNYALEAGVEYVVRISTTTSNVGPATAVFYGRNHWAVEVMLSQPEFSAMKWTSLQPNVFTSFFTPIVQGWLKKYRETGQKDPFKLTIDGDNGVAMIDPTEVGIIAAHLLALEDTSPHTSRKYVLVGPSNASGKQIVKLLEKHAGTTVDDVVFRDVSFIEHAKAAGTPENILASLTLAPRSGYDGGCSIEATPTSPEIMQLYAPKNGALDAIDAALAQL